MRSFTLLNVNGEVSLSQLRSSSLAKPIKPFSKSSGQVCLSCQTLKIDEAHHKAYDRQGRRTDIFCHRSCSPRLTIGKRCYSSSMAVLKINRKIVSQIKGFIHKLDFRCYGRSLTPYSPDRSLNFLLNSID